MRMADRWLTLNEAAERLRLSAADVLAMIRTGRLGGEQIDGAWHLQRCDVEALLRAGQAAPLTASEHIRAAMGSMRVPRINMHEYEIDPDALGLVPKDVCEKHRVIPVSRTGSTLIVAMPDAVDPAAIEEIKFLTALNVEPVLASENEIVEAIERSYGGK
jgi:hypothetical protein